MARLTRYLGLFALLAVALLASSPRAFCLAVPGDFTNDGLVNIDDLPGFRQAWIAAHTGGTISFQADMNLDKAVNQKDAELFLDRMVQPGTFYVQWSPSVTLVDQPQLGLLKNADYDNRTYTFDAAGVQAAGLNMSPGRILVIYGTDLRKIATTQQVGGDLVVTTTDATLCDAIVNGTIAWDEEVTFTPETVVPPDEATALAVRSGVAPLASNHFTIAVKIGSYNYTIDVTLADTRADCKVSVKRDFGGGVGVEFYADGYLEAFHSTNRIDIANGRLSQYGQKCNHLRGEMVVGATAATTSPQYINSTVEFPITLMKVPFLVGPILVEVDVRATFLLQYNLPVGGSSQLKAKFTYDSDLGFAYQGGSVTTDANVNGRDIIKDTNSTGGPSLTVVAFGLAFPDLQVSLLRESAAGGVYPAYYVEGDYQPGINACQKASAWIAGVAHYKLSVLDILTLLEGKKQLFRYDKELLNTCAGTTAVSLAGLDRPQALIDMERAGAELAAGPLTQ